MNTVSVVVFAISAAIIAFLSRATSNNEMPPPPHTLRVDGVDVTATLQSALGYTTPHLVLLTLGRGSGSVTVRFEVNRSLSQARMPIEEPLPERTIPIDQEQGWQQTDLGPLPENEIANLPEEYGASRQLVATADGTTWVVLWTENAKIDELIEKAGMTIKHRSKPQ